MPERHVMITATREADGTVRVCSVDRTTGAASTFAMPAGHEYVRVDLLDVNRPKV